MNHIVRALTLALTVTGMAAAFQNHSPQGKIFAGKVDTVPTPVCPPNDPNACGIGK